MKASEDLIRMRRRVLAGKDPGLLPALLVLVEPALTATLTLARIQAGCRWAATTGLTVRAELDIGGTLNRHEWHRGREYTLITGDTHAGELVAP